MKSKVPSSAKKAAKKVVKKTSKKVKDLKLEIASNEPGDDNFWNLRLYVAGQTPKSLMAFANLKRLCDEHLTDNYKIEVIDLVREPQRARTDQIVALPTLIRQLPEPIKRVIGDLSNTDKVKIGLDLKAQ